MSVNPVVSVRLAHETDLGQWQAFVDCMPEAGPLHHAAWYYILRDAFAVRTYFFLATDAAGTIRGIMPMYRSQSVFTGLHYTTLDGGILAADVEAGRALLMAAQALRNEGGVRYVQIRGGFVEEPVPVSFSTVHTVVPTINGADSAWAAIKQKTRWGVRQAEKQDLIVECDPKLDRLEVFYALYSARMHDLGTPVVGVDLFHAMRRYLGQDRLRLYILTYRGVPIGGMMCVVHGKRWTDLYAIVRPSHATEFANYFLYWRVIRDAADHGVLEIDLGRSTAGSTVHLFKRKWGGRDIDVRYSFYPANGNSGKFGLLGETQGNGIRQRIWSKLPLPICNVVGPLVRRDLPFL